MFDGCYLKNLSYYASKVRYKRRDPAIVTDGTYLPPPSE